MDQPMEKDGTSDASRDTTSKLASNLRPIQLDEKRTVVQAELARVAQLPSNSSYAIHRSRVLNKLLHLLSIQVISNFSNLFAIPLVI
jgi:hypothetical protein